MRFAPGPRPRDLHVTDRQEIYSIHAGNATVAEGGTLLIFGDLKGNVTVEHGGRLEVYGMIEGDVYECGGDVLVLGHIAGQMYHAVDDDTPSTAPSDPPPADRSDLDTERAAILQMIAQGRISVDEGDLLLRALD